MRVFDLDGTVRKGNISVDFFCFCMFRHPKVLLYFPTSLQGLVRYKLGLIDISASQSKFVRFVRYIKDPQETVNNFLDKTSHKTFDWYKEQSEKDDVFITTSPDFLVEPYCERLGVTNVISTRVDLKNATVIDKPCIRDEKLKRLREIYGEDQIIDELYTDSLLEDKSLVGISKKIYVYKNGHMVKTITNDCQNNK
ncbi:MAG: haloacid dehalogenase-like hydrolase [Bacilli bacterium]